MSVGNFGMLKNLDQVKRLADLLMTAGKTVSFDLETGYSGPEEMDKGALNVYLPNQFVAGFSITNDPKWARYVPLMHDFGDNLDPTEVWPIMQPVLEELPVLAHNVVFEGRNLHALDWKGHGPRIHLDPSKFHDSMLQSYVLSESPHHGLKFLSGYHYDHDQAEIETLFDKKLTAKQLKSLRFNVLELTESVVNYACDDVVWALRLDQDFRERCLRERGFIYKMELQIADILIDMADTGVSVDWDGINVGNSQFARFYQLMENRTRELFEESSGRDLTDLNFRSAPQMRKLLYGDLGLTTTRMTKGENPLPSTSEVALEGLRKQHPAVEQLLKYRQTKKMGEWFDAWSKLRVCNDEKIHPGFNQTRVQSGRFASDSPNVQNITKKWWFSMIPRDLEAFPETKEGNKAYEDHVKAVGTNGVDYWAGNARDYLIASPGYTLLSFDYQAAEMRVLAGLSQEPYLIDAFQTGKDVHRVAASLAFKVPYDEVTPEQRQRAKGVQFGLVYGQGAQGLAEGLGIPKDEAQDIMDKYFSAFSKVDAWFTKVKAEGFERGYVESFMGRKSTIWELESSNRAVRSKSERMFVNIPVQGGAADYCKVAMIRSKTALEKAGWWNDEVRLLMNQHDSLVYEVRDDLDMQEVIDLLTPAVSFPVKGFPIMEVDWEYGQRWGSVRTFGVEEEPPPAPLPEVETLDTSEVSKVYVVFSGPPDKDTVQEIGKVLRHHEGDLPVYFSISGKSLPLPMTITLDETLHADVTVASNGTACIETEQPTTEEVPA